MTNLCPYCKDFKFHCLTFEMVHEHIIDCSKTHISRILGMALKQFELDAAKVLDRRSGKSRRNRWINTPDRRKKDRTLYFYTNVSTGKFLDKDGFMLPDRRNHKSRRFPGERRRT